MPLQSKLNTSKTIYSLIGIASEVALCESNPLCLSEAITLNQTNAKNAKIE